MEETGLDYGISVRVFHVSCGTFYVAIFVRLPLFTKSTNHWVGLFPKDLKYTLTLDKSLYRVKSLSDQDEVENRGIDELMNEAIRYEARLFSEKFSTTSVASCEFEIFETEDILSRVSHSQVPLPDIGTPFISVEPTQIRDEPHFIVHYYSPEKLTKDAWIGIFDNQTNYYLGLPKSHYLFKSIYCDSQCGALNFPVKKMKSGRYQCALFTTPYSVKAIANCVFEIVDLEKCENSPVKAFRIGKMRTTKRQRRDLPYTKSTPIPHSLIENNNEKPKTPLLVIDSIANKEEEKKPSLKKVFTSVFVTAGFLSFAALGNPLLSLGIAGITAYKAIPFLTKLASLDASTSTSFQMEGICPVCENGKVLVSEQSAIRCTYCEQDLELFTQSGCTYLVPAKSITSWKLNCPHCSEEILALGIISHSLSCSSCKRESYFDLEKLAVLPLESDSQEQNL